MYTYIDNHLQQRKSSLSSLARNKKETSKAFQSIKNQQNVLSKQQSQQYIKSQQKSIMKSHNNDNINAIRLQDQGSSVKKCNPRLRQQQSSDYIRNLYKKYLGKQNKQPVDKLNAFTERKLKTAESKQVIATTNNTTVKDFTRRTLFTTENDQMGNGNNMRKEVNNGGKAQDVQSLMKKEKTKISHIVSIQSQPYQTPYQQQQQKSTHTVNDNNNKSTFQSNKKDNIITKKQDKQNYQKQCESKKSTNKNFKSKSKIQKDQSSQQQAKPIILKRSQSTHLKSQKSHVIEGSNNRRSVKGTGVEVSLSKGNGSKGKEVRGEQSGFVHPHRESYCQFDTQQEIQNNSNHQSQALNELNIITKSYQPLLNQCRKSTTASIQGRSIQNHNHNQYQPKKQLTNQPLNDGIFLRYINDLNTLELITGRQSSLFQTLQKINMIKNKKSVIKQENKLFEEKQINIEQRFMINHRLIL